MDNTPNEKKEALISAGKYTFATLINALTCAYFCRFNFIIVAVFLTLTILVASDAYYNRLRGFEIDKKLYKLEEEMGCPHEKPKDVAKAETKMVIQAMCFCILTAIVCIIINYR